LHQGRPDTKRLGDLQHARAAFVEAQDALFQFGPRHAPAFLIDAPRAILAIAAAGVDRNEGFLVLADWQSTSAFAEVGRVRLDF